MVLGFPGNTALAAAGPTSTAAMERNGRRSRGPSPNANNGGGSPDTSSDDENCEYGQSLLPGIDFPCWLPFPILRDDVVDFSCEPLFCLAAAKKLGKTVKKSEYEGKKHDLQLWIEGKIINSASSSLLHSHKQRKSG